MPRSVELLLLTKPGCHLCDDARAVVEDVLEAMADRAQGEARSRAADVVLDERNILDDAELTRLHAENIPVLFVNGRRHAIHHVDPERLAAAIDRAAKPRLLGR